MWNYRVVRKKTVLKDPESKEERAHFTYAVHEAYYDLEKREYRIRRSLTVFCCRRMRFQRLSCAIQGVI